MKNEPLPENFVSQKDLFTGAKSRTLKTYVRKFLKEKTMHLPKTSVTERLHKRALVVTKEMTKYEVELLEILEGIDRRKGFMEFGYSSLFQYVVEELGLSEARAYNFISVTRKSREVPALVESIKKGKLSVSKARKISSVLTKSNQDIWITKAEVLSQKLLEREVAKENPKLQTPEISKYIAGDRLELKMGLSEKVFEQLKRAQDLLSQREKKAANFEDTLAEVLGVYLDRKDPVKKAEKKNPSKGVFLSAPALRKRKIRKQLVARRVTRAPIPAAIQHEVFKRDKGKCQFRFQGLGKPCGRGRWIHLHHIKPVSQGGEHSEQNLTTLCSAHHRLVHKNPTSVLKPSNTSFGSW
jgi:hypothetical protein